MKKNNLNKLIKIYLLILLSLTNKINSGDENKNFITKFVSENPKTSLGISFTFTIGSLWLLNSIKNKEILKIQNENQRISKIKNQNKELIKSFYNNNNIQRQVFELLNQNYLQEQKNSELLESQLKEQNNSINKKQETRKLKNLQLKNSQLKN